jgi:molybdate transport system substrate-binding protein
VAIGDPLTVPAGKYAMNYLKSEGYEDKLKENLVYGKEVRVVTNYFNLGEVDFAIIYKTELEKIKGNYYTLSLNTKNKIEYSSGILLGRDSENVKKFYKFFETDKAKDIFKKAGYILSN